MNVYDERLEPTYSEKVSYDSYEELKQEKADEVIKRIHVETQLEDLVATILEFGNKYEFIEAYPKLIEYMKEMKYI